MGSLVMHPLMGIVHGLEAASAANETAKNETVNASSVSNLHSESGYICHLPLNCYAGHGADEIDYVGRSHRFLLARRLAPLCRSARVSSTWGRSRSAGGVATSTHQRASAVNGTQRAASSSRACTWISERLHSAPLHAWLYFPISWHP